MTKQISSKYSSPHIPFLFQFSPFTNHNHKQSTSLSNPQKPQSASLYIQHDTLVSHEVPARFSSDCRALPSCTGPASTTEQALNPMQPLCENHPPTLNCSSIFSDPHPPTATHIPCLFPDRPSLHLAGPALPFRTRNTTAQMKASLDRSF